MIQRVQSLLLLVVSICSACLLVFPFMSYENLFNSFTLSVTKQPYMTPWYYIAEILNLGILIGSFICIFIYKNRRLQMKIAAALGLASVALLAILLFTKIAIIEDFLGGTRNILWPCFLPALSMILLFMARAFIKKDDNLVRSADRIR